MARDDPGTNRTATTPPREVVLNPQVQLYGELNDAMLGSLLEQLGNLNGNEPVVAVDITTTGGDAEMGRRMIVELDLARERMPDTRFVFIGKSVVYSAGTTVMSAFATRDRFLSEDTRLMIHCRQLDKTLELSGPIRSSMPKVEALMHQLEVGVELEMEHFERLIAGSKVTMDELLEKALYNWYLTAEEAVERGLVAAVVSTEKPA